MENVIFGEKAIIYLFHRDDKNTVLEEVGKHNFGGEFLNTFKKVALNGSENVGFISKVDTHRRGQGRKGVTEWSIRKNGGPRLYVDVQHYGEKPVYVVLVVGDKSSQANDFDRAYRRREQLETLIKVGRINFLQEIIDAEPKEEPKVVSHHRGKGNKRFGRNYQNVG